MTDRPGPAASIVTPSFNQAAFLERTVASVLAQRVEGLEYFVADGGSRDGSVAILERHARRLRFVSEADGGQADGVNKGIAATRGEIIGWLNSDDVYYPGAVAAVLDVFHRHPEVDVVYGDADHIGTDDRRLEPYPTEPWNADRLHEVCYLCQPAVFFRRRVVDLHGALDASLQLAMDYELWLRWARRGVRFHHLRRRLAGSRLYPETKTLGRRLAVHAEINCVLRRITGAVPDRWLTNYAHVVAERWRLERHRAPLRFAVAVAWVSWLAALRWNGRLRPSLVITTRGWIRGTREAVGPRPPRRSPAPPSRLGRVGFDVSQAAPGRAGCGTHAHELAVALAERREDCSLLLYPTFGPEQSAAADAPDALAGLSDVEVAALPAAAGERRFWLTPDNELEAWLGEPALVHANNFFCPRRLAGSRLVYTLHDLAFLDHPEWSTERNRQVCFDGVFGAAQRADLVLSVSDFSRRAFLEAFPHYPTDRVVVVHSGSRFVTPSPVPRPRQLTQLTEGGFFLMVGTVEPRKNHRRVLEAYARVAASSEPPPLIVAGGSGWLVALATEISRHGLEGHVQALGFVEDETLQWLYQSCTALLYPSLYEGFGLPVVEAMSHGAPVLTSNCTALPEVAGDAALLVDPFDVEAIAAGIARLLAEPTVRWELASRGRERARRFTWQVTADRVVDAYTQVLEAGPLSIAPATSSPAQR